MGTKWCVNHALRMGLRNADFRCSQIRFRGGRGSSLTYKAVLDNEGNQVDRSRLAQLNQTMVDNNKLIKPRTMKDKDPKVTESDRTTSFDFHIPHYTKINGWDKRNKHIKELGGKLTSKKEKADYVVLEGTRLINEALAAGLQPSCFIFSRVKLLKEVNTEIIDKKCEFFHIPYENVKMWSDLKTPTGIMAAFDKAEVVSRTQASSPLPLTLICDRIRTPDNLGATLRVAAAAGAERVILTRQCVDPWSTKVLRAAAGAHFLVPILENVGWESMKSILPSYPHVVIADIAHEESQRMDLSEKESKLAELEERGKEEGYTFNQSQDKDSSVDLSYLDAELTAEYRGIPINTTTYSDFKLNPGCQHAAVVVGGETEGVSDAAYKFCHEYNGSRLYIPLRNNVNSLNVISASSIVMFRIQQALLSNSIHSQT